MTKEDNCEENALQNLYNAYINRNKISIVEQYIDDYINQQSSWFLWILYQINKIWQSEYWFVIIIPFFLYFLYLPYHLFKKAITIIHDVKTKVIKENQTSIMENNHNLPKITLNNQNNIYLHHVNQVKKKEKKNV